MIVERRLMLKYDYILRQSKQIVKIRVEWIHVDLSSQIRAAIFKFFRS